MTISSMIYFIGEFLFSGTSKPPFLCYSSMKYHNTCTFETRI